MPVPRKLLKDATELRESNPQVSFSMRGNMSYLDRARKRTRVTLHFLRGMYKTELSAIGRLHRNHSEDHTSPRHWLRRAGSISLWSTSKSDQNVEKLYMCPSFDTLWFPNTFPTYPPCIR